MLGRIHLAKIYPACGFDLPWRQFLDQILLSNEAALEGRIRRTAVLLGGPDSCENCLYLPSSSGIRYSRDESSKDVFGLLQVLLNFSETCPGILGTCVRILEGRQLNSRYGRNPKIVQFRSDPRRPKKQQHEEQHNRGFPNEYEDVLWQLQPLGARLLVRHPWLLLLSELVKKVSILQSTNPIGASLCLSLTLRPFRGLPGFLCRGTKASTMPSYPSGVIGSACIREGKISPSRETENNEQSAPWVPRLPGEQSASESGFGPSLDPVVRLGEEWKSVTL